MKKIILMLLFILSACAGFAAYPSMDEIKVPPGAIGVWDDATKKWYPLSANASGILTMSVTIATIANQLATGNNEIGEVGPDSASMGSATANALRPFATMLLGSDNSSLQRLFTAIVQGDGVNGNNMLPGVMYGYDGAGFDRIPASSARGIKMDAAPVGPASSATYLPITGGALIQLVIPSGARDVDLNATGTFEYYLGSTTWTASRTPIWYNKRIRLRGDGTDIIMLGQTATQANIEVDFTGE